MLNSGVNSSQYSVYIDDACGQLSEDIEYEEVQSLDAAAVVPGDAISVCIANRFFMSHTSAFDESM